jgi:hypothetical protein
VKDVRIRVKAVGPNDRSRLKVDPRLPKVGWITKWLGERATEIIREVRLGDHTIAERQTKLVALKRFYGGDAEHHLFLILRERIDREQLLLAQGSLPVCS